jgi:WD40 repeat protein
VKLYEAATGTEMATFRTRRLPPRSLAFDQAGSRLAYAGWSIDESGTEPVLQAELGLWDTVQGQELEAPSLAPAQAVTRLALSPDGHLLAGAVQEAAREGKGLALAPATQVYVWDLARGGAPLLLEGQAEGPINCLAFNPEGTCVAGAGVDRVLRLWDAQSGRPIFPPVTEAGRWTGLAFSPDGRRLAAAGLDGLARLWDPATGNELLTLRLLGAPSSGHYGFGARVAFSPDGTRLAANNWDGTVTVWKAPP